MKAKWHRRVVSAAMVLGSGMLLSGGNCMPDNFWVNAWGRTLNTGIDMTATTFVWTPLAAALNPPAAE